MLDKNDLQAIAKLMDTKLNQQKKDILGEVKQYIDEKVTDETNRAIAYTEAAVEPRLDAIKEGLDLALERPRVTPERVDRLEVDVSSLKSVVRAHSQELADLKKAQ